MFSIETIDGYQVVSGYSDGSEWTVEAKGVAGIAGSDRVRLWQLSPEGALSTWDIAGRRRLGEATLFPAQWDDVLLASGDGSVLYIVRKVVTEALAPDGTKQVEVEISFIDLDALKVVGRKNIPLDGFDKRALVMPDGALLLQGEGYRDDTRGERQAGTSSRG